MSYLQNFKYELHGPENSEKLVFLHGLLGSGANWRRIISDFKDRYHILTYDQRGHGGSFKPKLGYAPEDYALDLKLILDELGWQKIHLVGHSMGGRNALRFAFKFPERLHSLTVEDIGPEGNPDAMARTQRMIEMVPVPFPSRQAAKAYFEGPFLEAMKRNPARQMLANYLFTNISVEESGKAEWRFSLKGAIDSLQLGHRDTRWEEIATLRVPTLYMRGEHSDDLPQDDFEKILACNGRIEGHVFKGSGHWIHAEQPVEFIEVLRNFLSRHPAN